MNDAFNIKRLHVHLACLLDLRVGAARVISPDFGFELSQTAAYYSREEDVLHTERFGALSKALLRQVLSQRLSACVRAAPRTRIYRFLRELYLHYQQMAGQTPFLAGVEIEINCHGAGLTPAEKQTLAQTVQSLISPTVPVHVVEQPLQRLTPQDVAQRCCALVLYDWTAWLDLHKDAIQASLGPQRTSVLMNVGLFVPRLAVGRAPTAQEQQELQGTDLYTEVERALQLVCGFQYVPVAAFCADTPLNPEPRF